MTNDPRQPKTAPEIIDYLNSQRGIRGLIVVVDDGHRVRSFWSMEDGVSPGDIRDTLKACLEYVEFPGDDK